MMILHKHKPLDTADRRHGIYPHTAPPTVSTTQILSTSTIHTSCIHTTGMQNACCTAWALTKYIPDQTPMASLVRVSAAHYNQSNVRIEPGLLRTLSTLSKWVKVWTVCSVSLPMLRITRLAHQSTSGRDDVEKRGLQRFWSRLPDVSSFCCTSLEKLGNGRKCGLWVSNRGLINMSSSSRRLSGAPIGWACIAAGSC